MRPKQVEEFVRIIDKTCSSPHTRRTWAQEKTCLGASGDWERMRTRDTQESGARRSGSESFAEWILILGFEVWVVGPMSLWPKFDEGGAEPMTESHNQKGLCFSQALPAWQSTLVDALGTLGVFHPVLFPANSVQLSALASGSVEFFLVTP